MLFRPIIKYTIKKIITISNLLASNGSQVCGFTEELLLPAQALVDHQEGKSQYHHHLAGLAHVVTGDVEVGG